MNSDCFFDGLMKSKLWCERYLPTIDNKPQSVAPAVSVASRTPAQASSLRAELGLTVSRNGHTTSRDVTSRGSTYMASWAVAVLKNAAHNEKIQPSSVRKIKPNMKAYGTTKCTWQ